jgi:hypothetical protein
MGRNCCVLLVVIAALLDRAAGQQRRQLINQFIEQLRAQPPSRSHSPSYSSDHRNFDVIGTGGLPLQGPDRPGRAFKDFSQEEAPAAAAAGLSLPTSSKNSASVISGRVGGQPPSIEDVITGSISRFQTSAMKKSDEGGDAEEELPFLVSSSTETEAEVSAEDGPEAKALGLGRKRAPAERPRYPEEPIILTPPVTRAGGGGGAGPLQQDRPRKQKRPKKQKPGFSIVGKFSGPPPPLHWQEIRPAPPKDQQRRPLDDRSFPPNRNGIRLSPSHFYPEYNNGPPPFRDGPPPHRASSPNRALNVGGGPVSRPPFNGGAPPQAPPPPQTDFRGPPRGNEGPPPRLGGGRPAFLPQPIPRPGAERPPPKQQPPPPPPPSGGKGKPIKKGAKRVKKPTGNGPEGTEPGFQAPETIYHGFEPSFQGRDSNIE